MLSPELRTCTHCNGVYTWRKSTSALKMQFCTAICELLHEGFTIDSLLHIERARKPAPVLVS